MAGIGTNFLASDNSGVKRVKCIRLPAVMKTNIVRLGDFIVVSVYKGKYKRKFSFKKICFGLVLTRKIMNKRKAGYCVHFAENRLLLFAHKEKTIGNRLYGFITLECKYFVLSKLIVLAKITL